MEALDLYGGRKAVLERCKEQVLAEMRNRQLGDITRSLGIILGIDEEDALLMICRAKTLPEKAVLGLYKMYDRPDFLNVLGGVKFALEGPNSKAAWEAEMKRSPYSLGPCGPLTFEQYLGFRTLEEMN